MWLDAEDLRIKFVAGDKFFTILPEKSTDGYYYKHIAAIPTVRSLVVGLLDKLCYSVNTTGWRQ